MTETATIERPRAKSSNGRKRDRKLGPVLVSGNRLALHFGVARQAVDQLAQKGVIERNPQGLFDQDVSRLRYFAWLRSEHHRSPRTEADAEHTRAKTEMLQLKLMASRRDLVRRGEVADLINRIAGVTLTAFSSMPAQCAGGDVVIRRRLEGCVYDLRKKIATIALEMADKEGEPPLDQQ